MEYAEEKRKQEIKALQTEKDYKNKLLYLSTGVLVALLFSGFLYQQNRLKQKSNRIHVLEHKEILLQQEKLKREVERFEMQALRAQLNPHFIFNCLNSIDAFIYSNDKYKATTYLNKFAKLLRNILDGSYSNTVNVNLDIQSLKLYVELEELRNNHNFITQYDIDPYFDHSNLEVPPLLVQPIIENAIIHGLKNRNTDNGVLKISIKKLQDQIEYMIEDNGIGRKAASLLKEPTSEKTSSYGLALVQSRLKLFNREGNPSIKSEDILNKKIVAGTKVTVYLKFQPI